MRLLLLVVLAVSLSSGAFAAPPPSKADAEQARIERLAGLGRIWGAVRYFHPALATKPVDWDKALVEAIPNVDAAGSQAEYVAAINGMLAALGDPSTRARLVGTGDKARDKAAPLPENAEAIRLDTDQVLHIDAPLAARLLAEGDRSLASTLQARIMELATHARAAVVDLRRPGRATGDEPFFENYFMAPALGELLDRPVPLPSPRWRMHNGYADQTGSAGFYYSSLVTLTPSLLAGRRKDKALPLIFIVNRFSGGTDQVRGVRSAGLAWVVQEGAAPRANFIHTLDSIPGIELDMPVIEQVGADGSTDFVADQVVPPGKTAAAVELGLRQSFPRTVTAQSGQAVLPATEIDRRYADMVFPSKEYRLLALFRYWNVIEYFFPYKDLIGGDWGEVLTRYIPRFEANADAVAYQRTLFELATEIRDTHSQVEGATALQEQLGQYMPPLRVRLVEGQTVVTQVLAPDLLVQVGDTVLVVDGAPVEHLREQAAKLIAASTWGSLQCNVHRRLLRGSKGSQAGLRLRGIDGAVREVTLPRDFAMAGERCASSNMRSGPVVDVLAGGIGYVDLDRLQNSEVDAMFERLRKAPAIIFDMRGYPKNNTAWSIAPRLGTKQGPVAAQIFSPIVEASSILWDFGARYQSEQRVTEAGGERYTGKVVMLIDANAQSQAEHAGLFFAAATPTTFIGSPTAGANGNVSYVVVPGDLRMRFTGLSVRHADGRQLQRRGLQPDIHVEPTIAGIAAGRDEVLEAALTFLRETGTK